MNGYLRRDPVRPYVRFTRCPRRSNGAVQCIRNSGVTPGTDLGEEPKPVLTRIHRRRDTADRHTTPEGRRNRHEKDKTASTMAQEDVPQPRHQPRQKPGNRRPNNRSLLILPHDNDSTRHVRPNRVRWDRRTVRIPRRRAAGAFRSYAAQPRKR